MNRKLLWLVLLAASIVPASSFALESYDGVIFPASWAQQFAFACNIEKSKGITGWMPTREQIRQLEAGLPAALDAATHRYNLVVDRDILRQYAGLTINGKRMICVNAFPRNNPFAWRKDLVRLFDVGPSYFSVLYDPATYQFDHFSFQTTLR
jgi:hypothetical protein